ncbi:MAG: PulJ/GspJ family protein [Planctomycetota bacterium]
MRRQSRKTRLYPALTLTETVISLAIMAIIFGVLLPQLRGIQNSWDTQAGSSETLQNGRVLTEHLHRNLAEAARITAVSDSSTTSGYIEFIDNDANSFRYDVNSTSNYVEFGPVGSLSDVAGPVSQFQFACYDAFDLGTPITDVNSIRNVKVTTTLTNSAVMDQDMTFATQVYIRANTLPAAGGGITRPFPRLEYDTVQGREPALVHMNGTKYLCAYRGDRDDGFACILTVDSGNWSVSKGNSIEYDTKDAVDPALAKIDDTYALCAYTGDHGNGWAQILEYADPAINAYCRQKFDPDSCYYPALSHINTQGNDHYYLCAYGRTDTVHALVLRATIVPYVMMELASAGPTISWTGGTAPYVALARIDDTHYLCAYEGNTGSDHGGAVVLTVNTFDWTIAQETHYDFGGEVAMTPALAKIDDTHYLCAYNHWSPSYEGCAVVLTVNPVDWSITKETSIQIDTLGRSPDLCRIDSMNFLCAYSGPGYNGTAVILTVDTGNWTISKTTPFIMEYSPQVGLALCQVDMGHYLYAISGTDDDGFVGVLELGVAILP